MFNIKNVVSKITGRDSQPNSPGRAESASAAEENLSGSNFHSAEGFICPRCMKALPSPEELQTHYETVHNGEADNASPDSQAPASGAGFLGLHQEVGGRLQRQNGGSVNQERLMAEIQGITDLGELRKSLLDALESRAGLQMEKEALEQRTAQLARVNAAMQGKADEEQAAQVAVAQRLKIVEDQLAHRDSTDDAAVLREQIVFVQRAMDKMTQEKEGELEQLRAELGQLQAELGTAGRRRDIGLDMERDRLRDEVGRLTGELAARDAQALERQAEVEDARERLAEAEERHETFAQTSQLQMEDRMMMIAHMEHQVDSALAEKDVATADLKAEFEKANAKQESLLQYHIDQVKQAHVKLGQMDGLAEKAASLEKLVSSLTKKVEEQEKEVNMLNEQVKEYTYKLEKLEVKNARKKALLAEQEAGSKEREAKLITLQADLSKLNELIGSEGASKAVIQQLTEQNDALQKEIQHRCKQEETLKADVEALKDELTEVSHEMELKLQEGKAKISLLQQDLGASQTELTLSASQMYEAQDRVKELSAEVEKKKDELEAANVDCQAFLESYSEVSQLLEVRDVAAKQHEEEVAKIRKHREDFVEHLVWEGKERDEKCMELYRSNQALTKERADLMEELANATHGVSVLEKKLTVAEDAMQGMEVKKASLETYLFEYQKQLAQVDKEKLDIEQRAEARIERLQASMKKLEDGLSAEVLSRDAKIAELETELVEQENRIGEKDALLSVLRSERDEAKSLADMVERRCKEIREMTDERVEALNVAQALKQQEINGEWQKAKERMMTMQTDVSQLGRLMCEKNNIANNTIAALNLVIAQLESEVSNKIQETEAKTEYLRISEAMVEQLKIEKEQLKQKSEYTLKQLEDSVAAGKQRISEFQSEKHELQKKVVVVDEEKGKVQALLDAAQAENKQAQAKVEEKSTALEAAIKELGAERKSIRERLAAEAERFTALEKKYAVLNDSFDEVAGEKLALDALLSTSQTEHTSLMERYYQSSLETDTQQRLIADLRRRAEDGQSALHEMGRENQILRMELEKNSGRKWAEDSEATVCPTCSKEFSLITRRHHCRNCGQIFCNECSAKCAPVANNKKPVRVCDGCYTELAPPQ